MAPLTRMYYVNMLLGFVPDIVVGWVAARLTDSGWSGFFITLLTLQAIYFFFWLKTALWAWLLFWTYNKRHLAEHLENFFIDNRFPPPDEYTTDYEDYLNGISNNQQIDTAIRIKAAFELGTLNGFKATRRFSLILQLNSACSVALKRYTRLTNVVRNVAGQ